MERFITGDVVVVPFPFSDLSQTKRRPALVAADLIGDDLVLCQITSRQPSDVYAVEINEADFLEGGLKRPSYVRTNRLFTADRRIIAYKAGRLRSTKLLDITKAIISLLEN